MDKTQDWAKPHEFDDVEVVFPANALDHMPSYEECKEGLNELDEKTRQKWMNFQNEWFFYGLSEKTKIYVKEGIDGEQALRHLKVIQCTFACKHEHKEAAVAYLASQWFENVKVVRL